MISLRNCRGPLRRKIADKAFEKGKVVVRRLGAGMMKNESLRMRSKEHLLLFYRTDLVPIKFLINGLTKPGHFA